jgi:hypothetical protein
LQRGNAPQTEAGKKRALNGKFPKSIRRDGVNFPQFVRREWTPIWFVGLGCGFVVSVKVRGRVASVVFFVGIAEKAAEIFHYVVARFGSSFFADFGKMLFENAASSGLVSVASRDLRKTPKALR